MSRRLTTFVLAAFYLLQATWLLHAGVDLLLPPLRQAVMASGSCCTNACGCPGEAKAANDCCCVKHAKPQPPQKKHPHPSALEQARCKGIDDAMTQAFTQPVVSGFASIDLPLLESSRSPAPDPNPFLSISSARLEKVPIAQA
jgi:hypothetical protein